MYCFTRVFYFVRFMQPANSGCVTVLALPRFTQYASNMRGLLAQFLDYCAKLGSRVCASKLGDGVNPHFAQIIYVT